jgi:hypothetical protein
VRKISRPTLVAMDVGDSDDFDEEIKMTRANKKLMQFLDERGEQAKNEKLIPLEEVEERLGLMKRDH